MRWSCISWGCRGGNHPHSPRRGYGSPQAESSDTALALSRLGARLKRTCSIYDPVRELCVTADHASGAIQITLPPSLRSYFERLPPPQHERPRPLRHGLCKGLVEEEGTECASRPQGNRHIKNLRFNFSIRCSQGGDGFRLGGRNDGNTKVLSRERAWWTRRLGSAEPPLARPFESLPPRRIYDRVSGMPGPWEWKGHA